MSVYVNVRNNDDSEYEEIYNGDKIVIPGRSSIKMERRMAIEFVGRYPTKSTVYGPAVKALVIEPIVEAIVEAPKDEELGIGEVRCPMCNKICKGKQGLMIHLKSCGNEKEA